MYIVSAADEAFVPHFCAMLHSAWLFHPDAAYTLLACHVAEGAQARLRDFAASRRIALEIIPLDPGHVDALPTRPGLTAATYGRLFIADLLPDTADRAIYLDADITLNGSLGGLFDMDMRGMPLAAAPDIDDVSAAERQRLGLRAETCYFNCGVMLLDLTTWRRERIGNRIANFARTASEPLAFLDQSAVNVVLESRILPIARTFNAYVPDHFAEVADPVVIHYAGAKPWCAEWYAFHELYRFHRDNTPWPMRRPEPIGSLFKQLRRQAAALAGIPRYRALENQMRAQRAVRARIALPAVERARALLAGKAIRRSRNGVDPHFPLDAA